MIKSNDNDLYFRFSYSIFIYLVLLYIHYSYLISEHLKSCTIYIVLAQYLYNTVSASPILVSGVKPVLIGNLSMALCLKRCSSYKNII